MASQVVALVCLAVIGTMTPSTLGCGPANKEDLAAIMQHLGLVVDEHGLEETKYDNTTNTDYVTSANQLNCDFQNVKECRWTNAPTDNVTDHLNFYLFEKTKAKLWPLLNIRPSGQVPVGNKLILGGDKTLPEKGIVWYSSPIKCQKEPGTLSFKYWLWNFARIEVLLIEPGSHPLKVMDRPKQNCIDLHPDNTICTVTIPAQAKPFQLAIRLYNLRNLLGAIGMIDDIVYDAKSLCPGEKQPIDMGPDFNKDKNAIGSGLTGGLIEKGEDLKCSSFNDGCRWGNAPKSTLEWVKGEGKVASETWLKETGVALQPGGPFAYIEAMPGDSASAMGTLLSDPIPCQSGDGTVTFRYWLTPGVVLNVCALEEISLKPISCSTVGEFGSPGPRTVTISGPINKVFYLGFQASDFNKGKGGFAAVDDISYDARLCTQSTTARPLPQTTPTTQKLPDTTPSPTDLGESFNTQLFPEGLTDELVEQSHNLDCSFESAGVLGVLCQWGNNHGADDTKEWKLGLGPIDGSLLKRHTGSNDIPHGEFAHIEFDGFGQGSIVTDPMRCIEGDGRVTFKYWASEEVQMQACIIDNAETEKTLSCELVADGKSSGLATLPIAGPIDEEFRLRITALGTDKGFAIVDDINVHGDLCPATPTTTTLRTTTTTTPSTTTTSKPLDDSKACNVLKCNFDGRSLCGYRAMIVDRSSARFNIRDAPIGVANNVRIGWPNNDYVGVTLFRRGPLAVLESPTFQLNQPQQLRFTHMRGTFGSELHVCKNRFDRSLTSCTRVAGPSLTRTDFIRGTEAIIDLTPADKKVFIVASHKVFTAGRASFAVDNLQLTAPNGRGLC